MKPRVLVPVVLIAIALASFARFGFGDATPPVPAAKHFSHADHAARGVAVDTCASCHAVDAAGMILPPAAKGHSPCINVACHANDFLAASKKTQAADPAKYAKASSFCLGCHDQMPWPWKKPSVNAAKASYQLEREFHVEMNHYDHTVKAAQKKGGEGAACRSCHVVDATSFALVGGTPGHAQCVGCHNTKDFPDFAMDKCAVCHDKPARAAYFAASRPKTDVRACGSEGAAQLAAKLKHDVPCFKHERGEHRTVDGKPVQCASCHYMVGDKAKWAGRRYQSLKDLHTESIIDNSGDRQHASCGRSAACHKRDVNTVAGAKCELCHAEKSAF